MAASKDRRMVGVDGAVLGVCLLVPIRGGEWMVGGVQISPMGAQSAMNMNDTPVKQLDDVLIRWHNWCASEKYGAGYPQETSYCRMYRPSRQYDDSNGSLDAGIEGRLMQAVDAAIQALDRLERMALSVDARNLATGCQVWGAATLPTGEELVTLMAEARTQLREALERAGLW